MKAKSFPPCQGGLGQRSHDHGPTCDRFVEFGGSRERVRDKGRPHSKI